ncbi:Outer membrane lipoprotein Blc [bioreactor metagenome]|uniref:Outer membrane lipoprotein Blc n=1 Tax=bioreactor metagenome TaxID=1076179 RepID=A0A644WVM9_9ZZZZ
MCRKYIPQHIEAVRNFDLSSYLGRWYEIARFDFRFERNMNNTIAEYSLLKDGKVRVVNSGFNYVNKQRKQAVGKAKFRGASNVGELKVSFFGPFYAGYNVIALDPDYKYALVAGASLDYLWILSRTKSIPAEVKEEFLSLAVQNGFNVQELIWVEHDPD